MISKFIYSSTLVAFFTFTPYQLIDAKQENGLAAEERLYETGANIENGLSDGEHGERDVEQEGEELELDENMDEQTDESSINDNETDSENNDEKEDEQIGDNSDIGEEENFDEERVNKENELNYGEHGEQVEEEVEEQELDENMDEQTDESSINNIEKESENIDEDKDKHGEEQIDDSLDMDVLKNEDEMEAKEKRSDGLQDGHSGQDVITLKNSLTKLDIGNYPEEPSEYFGDATERNVKTFQAMYGLEENGIADQVTLEKIEQLLNPPFEDGDRNNYIVDLKTNLKNLGIGNYPDNPSAYFGDATERNVMEFQDYYGLEASGTADNETLGLIERILEESYQDGDSGDHIVELKQTLTALGIGNYPDNPSGYFGDSTERNVREFQAIHGLLENGIADEVTTVKIDELLSKPYKEGARHTYVTALKQKLTSLGIGNYPDKPSTYFGDATERNVMEFQDYYGLEASGMADNETLALIEQILEESYQDGDSGDHIVELKQNLTALGIGNYPDNPSSYFGDSTERNVREFQAMQDLQENGMVDAVTLAELHELLEPPYSNGNSHGYIVELKQKLTKLGIGNYPANPSINFGGDTENNVKAFQAYYGLEESGIADIDTLDRIHEILENGYQDGDNSSEIIELKQNLTRVGIGNYPDNPSDYFGDATERNVETFQTYYGLNVNGIADEVTLAKVNEILTSSYQDGESGDPIIELKQNLTRVGIGNYPESPSNYFGDATERNVESFQSYYGLNVNGIADDITLAKIDEILQSPYQDGGSGDHITELKQKLKRLGIGNYPDNPSNYFGDATKNNVKNFQENYGLLISGIADEITLNKLNEALEARPSIFHTDYDYSISNMVDIQAHRGPRTDAYEENIAYVSSGYIDRNGNMGTVTSSLNVRIEPNTRVNPVGSLNPAEEVTIISTEEDTNSNTDRTWYAIEFDHGDYWQFAQPADIERYIAPDYFTLNPGHRGMYQFLILSETSGVSASYLNDVLRGKGILENTGKTFVSAAETYHINEFYLLSHAILETGHGNSSLSSGSIEVGKIDNQTWVSIQPNGTFIAEQNGGAFTVRRDESFDESMATNIRETYNMFGIGALDSNPETLGSIRAYEEGWFSPEEAIVGGTQYISEAYVHHPTYQQNTLYKMRWNPNNPGEHQYATDIGWAYKQTYEIFQHYQELDYLRSSFDVPRYH